MSHKIQVIIDMFYDPWFWYFVVCGVFTFVAARIIDKWETRRKK